MELAPLQVDTVQLHNLANAVMCQDEDDLQKVMNWAGPDNGSRQHLLNSLQVRRCQCQHVACIFSTSTQLSHNTKLVRTAALATVNSDQILPLTQLIATTARLHIIVLLACLAVVAVV